MKHVSDECRGMNSRQVNFADLVISFSLVYNVHTENTETVFVVPADESPNRHDNSP